MEILPGKDNPLGTRWMGLSLKGYGIHGTNVQSSVGKAVSHGCFRMRKQDVEELYTLVHVGDTVMVRRERDAMIAKVFSAPTATQPALTLAAATQGSDIQVPASATRRRLKPRSNRKKGLNRREHGDRRDKQKIGRELTRKSTNESCGRKPDSS